MGKVLFFALLGFVTSCKNDILIDQKNDIYLSKNFNKYAQTYQQISDSLQKWRCDSLNIMIYLLDTSSARLDSMIVFNSDSTRLYTNVLKRDVEYKDAVFDYIYGLGGAKIHGKWYFFFGMNTTIDRASYQDSIYSPLSFEELSYLAREHLHKAYKIDQNGSIITNDQFFEFMYNRRGWGLSENSTIQQLDSFIVARTQEVRLNRIDLEELNQIKRHITVSKRREEPVKDVSIWQKWFGEKKLFESKEWKDYLKQKYGNSKN
ncbi:MAG TPA: hypothetical protein PK037_07885 [Saprospiraceae bacterium]|nr:hypothetical protein [Saprospiraceae bacterium]